MVGRFLDLDAPMEEDMTQTSDGDGLRPKHVDFDTIGIPKSVVEFGAGVKPPAKDLEGDMTMPQEPLVTIDQVTDSERPYMDIHGERYMVKHRREVGGRLRRELLECHAKMEESKDDLSTIDALIAFVGMAFHTPVPMEVLEELGLDDISEIAQALGQAWGLVEAN